VFSFVDKRSLSWLLYGVSVNSREGEANMAHEAEPKPSGKSGAMDITSLTQTSVKRFTNFMKFIADNNLWEEAHQHLEANGCTELLVSTEPINAMRVLLQQKLSAGTQLTAEARTQAQFIMLCGCGVSMPGPAGGPPKTPPSSGGGGDGGAGDGGDGGGGGVRPE
jgi:hypothetical protein